MKQRPLLYILASLIVLNLGCKKAEQEDKVVPGDDIIRIDFQTNISGLLADGQSLINFSAVVPAVSKQDLRAITLNATTGLGTFQGTQSDNKNILTVGAGGVVNGSLQVGSVPGTYFLSAEIKVGDKIYKSQSYPITLAPVPQSDLISLTFESDTVGLKADNTAMIKLKAKVRPSVNGAAKKITFIATTGLGIFQGTGGDSKSEILVDNDGIARATLVVGPTAGQYYIAAQVTEGTQTYKTKDYPVRLVPVPQSDLISLTFESDTVGLKADNAAMIKLKAKVRPLVNGAAKKVTFIATTGLGTFQGTGGDSKSEILVDNDGIARATLVVGPTAGQYYIAAQVTEGTQTYKTKDYPVRLLKTAATELKLSVDNIEPAADGFSILTITVDAKNTTERQVALTTTAGTFLLSPETTKAIVQLNSTGTGTQSFRISDESKQHIIQATIKDTPPTTLIITPKLSMPELIQLEPTALTIVPDGGSVQITSYLKKLNNEVKVTRGTIPFFNAYQVISGTKKNVGRFTGTIQAVSGANGAVPPVTFYADNGGLDATQPIIIEVSAYKNATELVTQTVQLKIK